jgi:hypothetical protein
VGRILALLAIEVVEEFVKCNEIILIEGVGIFARRREVNIFAVIYFLAQFGEIGTFFGSYLCPVFLLAEVTGKLLHGWIPQTWGRCGGCFFNPFVLAK